MTEAFYANVICTLIAVVAIGSALLVIGQAVHNPVNAVLWLIVAFVAVACYLITAGMTFLGLSYVIVYVGAIAVLFLFVVMMLNLANQSVGDHMGESYTTNKMWPVAIIIVVTGGVTLLPLSTQLSFALDVPMGVLHTLNELLYGGDAQPLWELSPGFVSASSSWQGMPAVETVSPMSQVQILGLTLYTHGALWLFIIGVLLMLAMLVPLALAFAP